jgi:tetratricopeptide (TPR) repeat protein
MMNEQGDPSPIDEDPLGVSALAPSRTPFQNQVDFEIALFRGILDRDPNYLEVLRVLGNNLAAKGRHAESLELDSRIVRLRPDDKIALYNLACSYAMVGMVDASIDSLEKAIAAGYDQFEYMRRDGDLEAVRQDPRFRRLLESSGVR